MMSMDQAYTVHPEAPACTQRNDECSGDDSARPRALILGLLELEPSVSNTTYLIAVTYSQ